MTRSHAAARRDERYVQHYRTGDPLPLRAEVSARAQLMARHTSSAIVARGGEHETILPHVLRGSLGFSRDALRDLVSDA